MSQNYDLFQGIEFIPVEKSKRGRGKQVYLNKNLISIRRKQGGNNRAYVIRFSSTLVKDLAPYDSARIARNSITGDIYFVFFKDGKGDVDLYLETNHSGREKKLYYPVLYGKSIVNAVLKHLHVVKEDALVRARVSDNLSNSEDFYTMMITDIISQ